GVRRTVMAVQIGQPGVAGPDPARVRRPGVARPDPARLVAVQRLEPAVRQGPAEHLRVTAAETEAGQRRQQAHHAGLAGADLHRTVAAGVRANLRAQQLDLVGGQLIPGQGGGRVGGQRRGEGRIGHQPLQHRVEVTHRRAPPRRVQAWVRAGGAAGRYRRSPRPRRPVPRPGRAAPTGVPPTGTDRTARGPHTTRANRTGNSPGPPWHRTSTTRVALLSDRWLSEAAQYVDQLAAGQRRRLALAEVVRRGDPYLQYPARAALRWIKVG